MLTGGIVLIVLGCILGGFVEMGDSMPGGPRLARDPLVFLLGAALAIAGIIVLFFVKWYAGLAGIAGSVIGVNLLAGIWAMIYKWLRL